MSDIQNEGSGCTSSEGERGSVTLYAATQQKQLPNSQELKNLDNGFLSYLFKHLKNYLHPEQKEL